MLSMVVALVVLAEPAKEAPRPRLVVSASEAPAYRIADGKGTATLFHNASTGSAEVALSKLELQPGAVVPEHSHDTGEWLMVVGGAAELTIDGQSLALKVGDAVFIPKGAKHTAKVPADAKAALEAVQVYSPAGAEQRYTKGARAK